MEDKTYYLLEKRGHVYIYHWLVYNIGGLRHLPGKRPIHICFDFDGFQKYHEETIELIKDEYIVETPPSGAHIIKHHGEPVGNREGDEVHPDTYTFLRNLFCSRISSPAFDESKFIYLTRKKSESNSGNFGEKTRQILNEDEIIPRLKDLGFQIVQFEDISIIEKINLFRTSKLIVGPNSGGMSFAVCMDMRGELVEIISPGATCANHYKHMCNSLGLAHTLYTDVTGIPSHRMVRDWNMNIHTDQFIAWVTQKVKALRDISNQTKFTLREWQGKIKHRDQLLYNCSEHDRMEDGWVDFPIGMQVYFINYPGTLAQTQIGTHTHLIQCSIKTHTDRERRPTGINRQTILENLKSIVQNQDVSSADYFTNLPSYKFVVSPEGNGIDCHRHYEALMAGCIPIVEDNDMIRKKYGNCPILYTKDYSEITPEYLEQKYIDMLDTEWDFSSLFMDSYSEDMKRQIRDNGNFWGEKCTGRKWST